MTAVSGGAVRTDIWTRKSEARVKGMELVAVRPEDRELLWNINQKYLYEMTNYYDDEMDARGNLHYGFFDAYFTDPERRAFFLYEDPSVFQDGQGAGSRAGGIYGLSGVPQESSCRKGGGNDIRAVRRQLGSEI